MPEYPRQSITWASASSGTATPYIQLHTTTPISTTAWNWTTATGSNSITLSWTQLSVSWNQSSGQWLNLGDQWITNVRAPELDRQQLAVEADPTLEARRAARVAARDRAEELLLSLCSHHQRLSYQEAGFIEGLTNLGHRYRIHCRRGVNGNVELLRRNEWLTLCAHPPTDLPHADLLLGQKLALETDEEYFLSHANIHRVRAA